MKNHFFLIIIIFLFFSNCHLNYEHEFHSEHFELKKLEEGVFACIHKFGGKAICNTGIIDNGESTIIFDSFLSPDAATELKELVLHLKLSPIKYVVNSHAHNDHIRGNQVFGESVKIIATKTTAKLMAKHEPEDIKAESFYAPKQFAFFDSLYHNFKGDTTSREFLVIKMMHPYFEELAKSHSRIKTRLPEKFVEDKMFLNGPQRQVQLIVKGKGHTQSDLVLYLPKEEILFTGDLVFNQFHPYLAEGFPTDWKNALNSLAIMKVKKVIPGHGEIGGKEILNNTRDYIQHIEDIVLQFIREGQEEAQLNKIVMPSIYDDWWLANFFPSNISFMYKLKEKK